MNGLRLFAAGAVALLVGCAPLAPVPFELLGDNQAFHGAFFPSGQRLEATIGGRRFQGFYIVAAGIASSHSWGPYRRMPNDVTTTYSTNSARAMLSSPDGERLSCEFLIEDRRALGECKSTSGQSYQLIADQF